MRVDMTACATLLAASLVGCGQETFGTANDAATGDDRTAAGDALGDGGPDAVTNADCGDLQTNPESCGACNHRCLGGDCDSGTCMPVTLATNQAPYLIAVDNDGVYWTTLDLDGGVTRANKDGGAQLGLVTHTYAQAIAVSKGYVYFSGASIDGRVLTDGGGLATVPASLSTQDLAVGPNVYGVTTSLGGGSTVNKRDLSLGSAMDSPTLGAAPRGIALDATQVYVTTPTDIRSFSAITLALNTTLPSQAGPEGIAVDGSDVFWTNNSGGTVQRAATNLGLTVAIVDGQTNPHRIALDAKYVYWVTGGGSLGTIMRADKHALLGTPPKFLFSGPPGPRGIAVDDEAVYWTNELTGAVMKVAKPID